jgi:hypothetical protein
MDTPTALPAQAAPLWAVALRRPNLRIGPYDDRRQAARVLLRLLARHPTWRGRVAPWGQPQP